MSGNFWVFWKVFCSGKELSEGDFWWETFCSSLMISEDSEDWDWRGCEEVWDKVWEEVECWDDWDFIELREFCDDGLLNFFCPKSNEFPGDTIK